MLPHRSSVASLLGGALLAPPALAQVLPVTTSSEQAREHFEAGRIDAFYWQAAQAHEHLDAALAADSTFVLAYLHRAGTSPRSQRAPYFDRAEAHRDRVTRGEQRLIDAFRAFLMEDDNDRAIEILQGLSEEYPADPYLRGYLGMRYYNHFQDYDKAERQFGLALERDAGFTPAYQLLGWAAMGREDYDAAEGYFTENLRHAPDEPMPYHSLGELHVRQGRYVEAATQFERALEMDPSFERARTSHARATIEAKTSAWADAMVEGTAPDLVPDLFTEGAVRMGAGRQQHGREAILQHARTFPRYADAAFEADDLVVVGDVAYGTGRYTIETLEGSEGSGVYLNVWRREADGGWRIDRIVFQ